MCDNGVYTDPLPEVALTAMRGVRVMPEFISLNEDRTFRIEIANSADRLAAFVILSKTFPADADWKRIHVAGPMHTHCMNCSK